MTFLFKLVIYVLFPYIYAKLLRISLNKNKEYMQTGFQAIVNNIFRGRTRSAFDINQVRKYMADWEANKPQWVALSKPEDYERASRENPIVRSCIDIVSEAASNGRSVAVDINTNEIIPWSDSRRGIKETHKLFEERPNPLQSPKEFKKQGYEYYDIFGNRFSYINRPIGVNKREMDILDVSTLINLPSQFTELRTTGKLYDQTTIEGIVSEYVVTNTNPITRYLPSDVIHFNTSNTSSNMASILGIPKMEALKMPISNTQLVFERINTLLYSGGMSGIISPSKKDAQGANIQLTLKEQEAIDKEFKKTKGTRTSQNLFWLSPIQMDFIKTAMSAKDLAVYEELASGGIIIANGFNVPPELIKLWIAGATYENQVQSERRLYNNNVIPRVTDDDKYWSYVLNLKKYGFRIESRWDHIACLSENFKDVAVANNMDAKTASLEWNNNSITMNEYRAASNKEIVTDGDLYKLEWDKKHGGNNGEN